MCVCVCVLTRKKSGDCKQILHITVETLFLCTTS